MCAFRTTQTAIQKRESSVPIHPASYQQRQRSRLTRKDKRYMVYCSFLVAFLLLLLAHSCLSSRYHRIAAARAALGQAYVPPDSNLFALFLTLSLALGLYAFVATFYRRHDRSHEVFLSTAVLILLLPPVYLGRGAVSRYCLCV